MHETAGACAHCILILFVSPAAVPHVPLLHAPGYRRASSGLNALPSFKGEPVLKQHGKALVAALAAIVEGNTSAIQRPLSCTTNAPPNTQPTCYLIKKSVATLKSTLRCTICKARHTTKLTFTCWGY